MDGVRVWQLRVQVVNRVCIKISALLLLLNKTKEQVGEIGGNWGEKNCVFRCDRACTAVGLHGPEPNLESVVEKINVKLNQGSKNRPPSGHLRLKNPVWRVKHSF